MVATAIYRRGRWTAAIMRSGRIVWSGLSYGTEAEALSAARVRLSEGGL